MKKIIYLLVWIGMTLASCSDESSLPIQPEIPAEPETPKDEPAPEKDYHQLPVLHVEGRDGQSSWIYTDLQSLF